MTYELPICNILIYPKDRSCSDKHNNYYITISIMWTFDFTTAKYILPVVIDIDLKVDTCSLFLHYLDIRFPQRTFELPRRTIALILWTFDLENL